MGRVPVSIQCDVPHAATNKERTRNSQADLNGGQNSLPAAAGKSRGGNMLGERNDHVTLTSQSGHSSVCFAPFIVYLQATFSPSRLLLLTLSHTPSTCQTRLTHYMTSS